MLGPFNSYSDALLAACRKILTKPNATAGRPDQQDFSTRWRVATEYCAWVYYTPDHKYVVSKLTDQANVDPANRYKSCLLPSSVDDSRYPPGSIKYIYALHNHPLGSTLSPSDIDLIVSMGDLHGFETNTKNGVVRLSLVAFFSEKIVEPTCDGFHQYIPLTGQILTWTRTPSRWDCRQTGLVTWRKDRKTFDVKQLDSSCTPESAP
jgi:hypothetical protein